MSSNEAHKAELSAVVKTDVGVVRDHNEDSAYASEDGQFYIVADGMGGHAAGEVASAMAVDTVREVLFDATDMLDEFATDPTNKGRQKLIDLLENAVRLAHKAVFERGIKESDKQGMGTTLDVLLVAGGDAFVAHVGDSRTYLIRDGKAAQITTDHTVAEVLMIEGKLTAEEAAASHLRTILVNAIGVAEDVGVEMAHLRLKTGDRLLLCSDGLHDYFPVEQELADLILDSEEQEDALVGLIELAKERGGHDNITGVLIEVVAAPESEVTEEEEAPTYAGSAVPTPIGDEGTMPVAALSRNEERKLATATTAEHEAVNPADDGESAPAAETEPESAAKRSVLKTTVPIRPLNVPLRDTDDD